MRICFEKLTLHNFMSFQDSSVDLTNAGFTLVDGKNNSSDNAYSNGSGKSSLFEALIWCLTGETLRGTKDVVNTTAKDGTFVTLDFTYDNDRFFLRRSKEHKEYKTNLYIERNNENISGKGIRDTEKILKDILPDVTTIFLGSVIILGQGLPIRFTQNSPSGRKDVLEQLSKSDFMIEDLKNRVQKRENELKQQIRGFEDNILICRTSLDTVEKQKQAAVKSLESIPSKQELEKELRTINNELSKLAISETIKLSDEHTELLEQKVAFQNKLLQIQQDIDAKFSSGISSVENEIQNIRTSLSVLSSKIAEVERIKDVCPTCGQKITSIHKPCIDVEKAEYSRLSSLLLTKTKEKTHLDNTRLNAQQQAEEETRKSILSIDNRLLQLEQQVRDKVLQDQQREKSIKTLTERKSMIEKQITQLDFNADSLQHTIEECSASISRYQKQIEINQTQHTNLESRLDIQSKFSSYLKRDFRGYLLTNVIEYLNNRVKEYSQDIFDKESVEFILDGNNILIKYDGRDYENLSGGERQKVDLIVQFAIRDMLSSYRGFSSSLLVLDEIFDNLDSLGCSKVIDFISKRLSDVVSIYIISHHSDELNIPVDNILHVIKNKEGNSTITL